MTKLKFRCIKIVSKPGDFGMPYWSYKFYPCIESSENKDIWEEVIPAGKLELFYISENMFIAGKEYYLDITEVK